MNGLGPAAVMFIIHPRRINLFFQDVDLPLQLLFQKIRLVKLVLGSLDREVDLLDFLLDRFIFRFHFLIAAVGLIHLLFRCGILFFQFPDLLTKPFLLKKEHVDIVSLEFFFFLQIFPGSLCLLFQRTELFLQFLEDIVDTGQIHPFLVQFSD